ncbi:MAG TPA: hypothetical protein VF094_12640 [Gaiellaceae bacterium]
MSFFEPPPPPPEPPEPVAAPPWHGPPGNELGVAVPIRYVLVRTDELAILLDGLVAFSTGVELEVTVKSRNRQESHEFHRLREDVHVGFRFADGRKATSLGHRAWDEERPDPLLMQRGGSGSDRELRQRYWLWPLPPPGPLQAVVAWPERGIAEAEVEVDGAAILEAAARVDTLWPNDGEPSSGGWTSSTVTATRREPGERDG